MKKLFRLLLLAGLMHSGAIFAQDALRPLTHHMSADEELRKHEIGRDFTPTDPPAPPTRNVAEFEEMKSVLIRYPFGIPMSLIKEMAEDCKVKTIVASAAEQTTVLNQYTAAGVNTANCEWLIAPSNSYWTRDYGPWYVVDGSNDMGISDFPYNRPRPSDDNIPVVLAQQTGLPLYGMNLLHTGGNYMCDGMGIGASTDLVWEENTNLTAAEIDTLVKNFLGLRKYHVMPDPLDEYIKHIDCWGKFLDVDKVLIGQVPVSDYRYDDFEYVANYFSLQTSSYGNLYQVYRVYTPGNYPYTPYTNSLILNKKVFVPQTGSQWDDEAIISYQNAMPGYEIVGIMHNTWENTDALHCRAIGIADENMLHIEHMPLLGQKNFRLNWTIEANFIPYSGNAIIPDSLKCFYKINTGEYTALPMTQVSGSLYRATLPKIDPLSQVSYYIKGADWSGHRKSHPFIGAPDPHQFTVKYATDAIIDPDTLDFLTVEEMLEGKTFYIYNYTNSDLTVTDIENEGMNPFHWYIDPWTISLPHIMEISEALPLTVKLSIPVDQLAGMLVTDTLDITTQYGLKRVILRVDSDLLSSVTDPAVAKPLRIESVAPNPFSSSTRITISVDRPMNVRLTVSTIQGQEMAVLADQKLDGGSYEMTWSGVTANGRKLSAGVYVLRLSSASGTEERKLIVL
jgi:agmatine/peptidylarginine deiminase